MSLSLILTLVVFFQENYLFDIKESITNNRILLIIQVTRILMGMWIVFVTETTIIAVSKVTAIQLIILLLFWACSKYVQKTRENWLITIVAFVIYGVGTYLYIQFAFRGY
ncbi:putative membrane protein [Bacillus cereus ATCC 10876]|nr:putative membrane protein [Bacillus cereus ATCC 10876]